MESLLCYRLTERNSWEGETWYFYIELTSKQHAALSELIEGTPYSLSSETFDTEQVNTLVEESGSGYMAYHNYVGCLIKPLPTKEELGSDDPFYKGGIEDFCSVKIIGGSHE